MIVEREPSSEATPAGRLPLWLGTAPYPARANRARQKIGHADTGKVEEEGTQQEGATSRRWGGGSWSRGGRGSATPGIGLASLGGPLSSGFPLT